ncbi:ychB [Wigglesworthia glossinidia endosymbiont of Glossina brevipalpis]|uniref:4-diphosphocytidyl-2-C-methyl-D-erythritol kinase n=1 Tax=Wigglesworthia glossinidia brevipalpis TaxID=36870 RepID=ISPE_WIGBR|nr:RecName: Full=4-diphosphocytidyl-2-C-methyl-D-erythritol kinase; Short=CMK; AltName: Full=4-(cytidine-5'-diphospho)-2-C-methyl-D-erythritol kinase [Wigglesworthia glossinidia endosymbiont of Glossina brevipalpis]BAC24494.1 ychB [Wigglesworthia glossinidia endosymbiont of Glossina brevipalpis]
MHFNNKNKSLDCLNTKIWPSPAKINLFLSVTGIRKDGYHFIQTLFQFLNYGDYLIFNTTSDKKIKLINKIHGIRNENNLIIRAAKSLKDFMWKNKNHDTPGVKIFIKKYIPIGGGLGGGSSNAATTLIALNEHWKCKLSLNTLADLGLQIGIDIPVFIYGKSAFAEGIGEKLSLFQPKEKFYLIVIPPIKISTKLIFNKFILNKKSYLKSCNQYLKKPLKNDFEPMIRKNFIIIDNLINYLSKFSNFRLTGTGSCIFSEFDSECKAKEILYKLPNKIKGFVSKGTNISYLKEILKIRSNFNVLS